MNKFKKKRFIRLMFYCISLLTDTYVEAQAVSNPKNMQLWYRQPADQWEEALPLGNGSLAAMVCGGVEKERIYLNEASVWSGQYHFNANKEMPVKIEEIRKLLFAGNYEKAQELTTKYCTTINDPRYGSYQPLGDLYLTFSNLAEPVSEYKRTLDLATATASVEYKAGPDFFKRELFVSAVDKTLVIRLTCSKKGMLNFDVEIKRDAPSKMLLKGQNGATLNGRCDYGGAAFQAEYKVINRGGEIIPRNNKVSIVAADEVLILLTATTDYWKQDPVIECSNVINVAAKKGYGRLLGDHKRDYQTYFNRVAIDLGSSSSSWLPTDERIKKAQAGTDEQLSALFFQYGRYLLISSSRPGGLPANLQGIWNKDFKPAWFCDYTININFQMNYWPAEVCNLSEMATPMFHQIERMYPAGKKSARERYGRNGWELSTRSTPWGINELRGQASLLFQDAAAWLCTHLWEHYQFSGDMAFLKKYYPLIRDAAVFYDEFLIQHPAYGFLVSGPNASPENKFYGPDGKTYSVDMGTTMSTQIIHDIFTISASASKLLGVDSAFSQRLLAKRSQLAPMRIGVKGQLLEWIQEYPETELEHRHVSHLYGLFPSNQISPDKTPELANAANKTLVIRGDGGTGWSKAWKICFWARLLDGDHAHKMIMETFTESTLPNLFNNHPPFQIDGNFGTTAGIAEMLLQSQNGELHVLPALPSTWPTGYVEGLIARGGFIVDMYWKDNTITKVRIVSKNGGICNVRYKNKKISIAGKKGREYILDENLRKIK